MLSWILELTLSLYIFRRDLESDSEAEDVEHAEKLRQVKAVLEEVINALGTVFSIIILCIMNPVENVMLFYYYFFCMYPSSELGFQLSNLPLFVYISIYQ